MSESAERTFTVRWLGDTWEFDREQYWALIAATVDQAEIGDKDDD